MIYCQIKNGVVVNRALFDAAMPSEWPEYATYVQDDEAQIGWHYADGTFTPPEPVTPAPPPFIPDANVLLLDHENRIRSIEGEPPLTMANFIAVLKGRA